MKNELKFISPIDGDVLFDTADGTELNGFLHTKITVKGNPDSTILINGIKAKETESGIYEAEIELDTYRNTVEAECPETNETAKILVFWFRNAYKTYR